MAMQTTGLTYWPEHIIYHLANPSLTTFGSITVSGTYMAVVINAPKAMTITHVGFMTTTVVGSPQATITLENVDATTGVPDGTLVGASGSVATGVLTASAWTLHQLGAAAGISVVASQTFAVKFTLNTASTTLSLAGCVHNGNRGLPYRVFATGAATKANQGLAVSMALGSSSSAFYYVPGLLPQVTGSNASFSSASGNRRGLRFKLPYKARCCGIIHSKFTAAGDYNIVLYDDAGNELNSCATAYDGNQDGANTAGINRGYFDNPVTLSAGTWYRAAIVPTSATTTLLNHWTIPTAAYITAAGYGADAMYTSYTTGGGWDDSQTTLVPELGLILDQFDDGVAAGGGSGASTVIGS